MYLSYENYQNMGGALDETAFNDFEFEAETIVNWYTFDRLKNMSESDYPKELERCIYRLIKLLQELADANATIDSEGNASTGGTAAVASQSNDGVSVSYNVVSASQKLADAEKEKSKIVQMYLQGCKDSLGRKLLYRGLYPGE